MVSADDEVVVEIHLSARECHDGPEGRVPAMTLGKDFEGIPIWMGAYEGDETRALAAAYGHEPMVPQLTIHHQFAGLFQIIHPISNCSGLLNRFTKI